MIEYISSFTTGFEEIIYKKLSSVLDGAKVINVYNGLVHYKYDGNSNDIIRIPFFNNSFYVIKFFDENKLSFDTMVSVVSRSRARYPINSGTFRVRFMRGNQFTKVDKQLSKAAELIVGKQSTLNIDRVNPSTELWYVIREEGYGFYGQLIEKRAVTEKNLDKGELRPEFAFLMCLCAEHTDKSVIMDPFAGFGAIPIQIKRNFPYHRLIINDIDAEKIQKLKRIFDNKELDSRILLSCDDALHQPNILRHSIDTIITDPPWGYYEEINDIRLFYKKMLKEFHRVIKVNGTVVILSARKEEFVESVESSNFFSIRNTVNTLVNGKKASVYVLEPTKRG